MPRACASLLLACLALLTACARSEAEWLAELQAEEPFARVLAVTALAQSGQPEVVPHLLAALDDVSEDVRAAGGAGLARLAPHVVPRLLSTLEPGAAPSARRQALEAVPSVAEEAALPLAEALLDGRHEPSAVLAALQRLGAGPGQAALPPLRAALRSPEAWRRRDAAEGLRAVDPVNRDSIVALLPLARDPDPEVRDTALQAAVAGLLMRQREGDPLARHAAQVQLETLGEAALPALARALREAESADAREPVEALAAHGPAGLRAALDALNPRNPQHVLHVQVLSRRVGPDALPLLLRLRAGSDARERLMATLALGPLGAAARAAVPGLLDDLDTAETLQRFAAAHALGLIGPADDAQLERLLAALHAGDGILQSSLLAGVADALLERMAARPDPAGWEERYRSLGPAGRDHARLRAQEDGPRGDAARAFLARD